MSQLFNIGIKGLIRNKNGQYLLLKANVHNHSSNTEPYWDIPGGRIEEGEDAITTLKREIFEETGVKELTQVEFLTAVISNHKIPLGDDRFAGLALHIFTVQVPDNTEISLNAEEHTKYAWFTPVEAAIALSNKYPPEFTDILV